MADKKRDRKANFTAIEANLISQRATDSLDILKGKHSLEVTNQVKNELWKKITEEVNALGICQRTEAEVRNKFRNMCRGAKEKFVTEKRERSKTGGGPAPSNTLSQAEENIVNVMKDTASFQGIGGLESNIVVDELSTEPPTESGPTPAESAPTPTESVPTPMEQTWINALERIHRQDSNVGDTAGTRIAETPRSSTVQLTGTSKERPLMTPVCKKRKYSAEDVYELQCAVLQKELVKNDLQIKLLKQITESFDAQQQMQLDTNSLALFSALTN